MGNVFRCVACSFWLSVYSRQRRAVKQSLNCRPRPLQCPDLHHRTNRLLAVIRPRKVVGIDRVLTRAHAPPLRRPGLDLAQTLRETIEAAIIVSVLLGLVESLVHDKAATSEKDAVDALGEDEKKKIIKRMRLQIWAGAIIGTPTRKQFLGYPGSSPLTLSSLRTCRPVYCLVHWSRVC